MSTMPNSIKVTGRDMKEMGKNIKTKGRTKYFNECTHTMSGFFFRSVLTLLSYHRSQKLSFGIFY